MKSFKDFLQESIKRRTVSYGQGPKKKLGQIDFAKPTGGGKPGASKNYPRSAAQKAKDAEKVKKALDREKRNDKPGMTKRSDDYRRKNYQSGQAGAHFSRKYRTETVTTGDAGIPQDTADMGQKKKRSNIITRAYIEVMDKKKKIMK